MKKYVESNLPTVKFRRSRFDLSHRVLTSGSLGYFYPFDKIEVLPGDTMKFDMRLVTRLSSPLVKPLLDNMFIDVYFFFVPNRIVYERFVETMGENKSSAWAVQNPPEIPTLSPNSTSDISDTQNGSNRQVACCLGMPVGQVVVGEYEDENEETVKVLPSVIPFRAFAMIYDEFFRDENSIAPMLIQKGVTHSTAEGLNSNAWAPNNYTGCVPKVAKMHDYFTSCLPAPQKGNAVDIPISFKNNVPVVASEDSHDIIEGEALHLVRTNGTTVGFRNLISDSSDNFSAIGFSESPPGSPAYVVPDNLWAQLGLAQGNSTVNDMRFAFQFQKLLEADARGGTRYIEYLMSHFGVNAGDTRLQRPEFLGGKRIPINITQVVQTTGYSEGDDPQTLGQLGAYSLSGGKVRFTKSFTEHGYIIPCYCIRQFHTYQQGLSRDWFRRKRSDFYDPIFAHLGEQPVYKYQLFADEDTIGEKSVFGYQEAWAEYRKLPNIITGQMSSNANDSLDKWHLGDVYGSAPVLGQQFLEETPDNLDDVLTVESSSQDQFVLDFWVGDEAIRVMPTYSVPGLIDHV